MEFIDLENDYPATAGTYTVLVEGTTKTRECKATWSPGIGFTLLEDRLGLEEYITKWQ
jgi:hypothetical protein